MLKKTILISQEAYQSIGSTLQIVASEAGHDVQFLMDHLSEQQTVSCEVDAAFLDRVVFQGSTRSALSPRAQQFFDTLERSRKLQWVHVFSSGADRLQYKKMQAAGVKVTTSAGGNAQSVATLALAGMLALNKKLPKHWKNQQQKHWSIPTTAEFPCSMEGQTAVIVGTGHIGCQLATYLRVLGVTTIGINRSGREVPAFDQTFATSALSDLAGEADWLIVCCPLTAETHHLIDAKILNSLPQQAYLVNVGRAAIVDENALLKSLRSGQIAGAHLDVFDPEPLPARSEFWHLDNVIVTPHAGAQSTGIEARVNELYVKNFKRWLVGESLLNLQQ